MQTKKRIYHPPPIPPAINPHPATLPAPDLALAQRDAAATLAAIDWTRPIIVLWVPGTNRSGIPQTFAFPAHAAWGARASVVELQYPASFNLRPGVATGLATLKLVLAGIAAHGGTPHTVHLAGESQGAWAITELLAEPMLRAQVDRAVLLSNPAEASRHFVDGHDPRVLELSRRVDIVARQLVGDPDEALDAAEGVIELQPLKMLKALPVLIKVAVHNPGSALLLVGTVFRLMTPGGRDRDPHNYEDMMPGAVQFLRVGEQQPTLPVATVHAPHRRPRSALTAAHAGSRLLAAHHRRLPVAHARLAR